MGISDVRVQPVTGDVQFRQWAGSTNADVGVVSQHHRIAGGDSRLGAERGCVDQIRET